MQPLPSASAAALIARHLADPASSWHVGAFGAIAEFHHDGDLGKVQAQAVDTPWGAIQICRTDCLPLAYELVSAHWARWQHGVAFCLPQPDARMNVRSTITLLGEDRDAIRPTERRQLLFDLGLGLPYADFCVRTDDPELVDTLISAQDQEFLSEPALFRRLCTKSPHRVVISRLGRIEVRQRIPHYGERTPSGSHTHLLPRLLRRSKSHAATIPVPAGWVPCLWLYPPHPIQDADGLPQRFDAASHTAFQRLLEQYGDKEVVFTKTRVYESLRAGKDPVVMEEPASRHTRLAMRVALRQFGWIEGPSALLDRWQDKYDS